MASRSEPVKRQKIDVLGVKVDDMLFDEAVSAVFKLAQAKNKGKIVVTVNSEFVMLARRDPKFKKILNNSDLALPDGQWVANSKLILGGMAQDRVPGVDILEEVCKKSANLPITVGFLGGFGGVADEVDKRQKKANRSEEHKSELQSQSNL